MNILEVKDLTVKYKNFTLQNISFDLPAGYIMGYIGKNGAGKTTTLNAITHLVHAHGGEVKVEGLDFKADPIAYREKIGYVGDASYFPGELRLADVRSILKNFYPSFDAQKFDEMARQWKLPEKYSIKEFSRGEKVRLMFASVLSRKTSLLILDEATNGLDPIMRREILNLLQEYIQDGTKSILFSTHIMEDLQDIADYIFCIDEGKKVFLDTKDALLDRYLLVGGDVKLLDEETNEKLIGVEKHEFGFSALFDKDSGETLPENLTSQMPSIDQIVVHLLK